MVRRHRVLFAWKKQTCWISIAMVAKTGKTRSRPRHSPRKVHLILLRSIVAKWCDIWSFWWAAHWSTYAFMNNVIVVGTKENSSVLIPLHGRTIYKSTNVLPLWSVLCWPDLQVMCCIRNKCQLYCANFHNYVQMYTILSILSLKGHVMCWFRPQSGMLLCTI